MSFVFMFVDAAGIVKEGKQLDNMTVGSGLIGEHQTICPHTRPMGNAVVAPPVDSKLVAQVLQQGMTVENDHSDIGNATEQQRNGVISMESSSKGSNSHP